MIQKLRTPIFSTTLLTMVAFSVHAMEVPELEKKQTRKRPQCAERPEKYKNKGKSLIHKEPIELNQFGVTPLEYENVISFYSTIYNRNNFVELFDLFMKISVDHRSEALKDLELKINSRGFRPMFSTYQFLPNGIVTDTPSKTKDAISLQEKLLQLPYQPR